MDLHVHSPPGELRSTKFAPGEFVPERDDCKDAVG